MRDDARQPAPFGPCPACGAAAAPCERALAMSKSCGPLAARALRSCRRAGPCGGRRAQQDVAVGAHARRTRRRGAAALALGRLARELSPDRRARRAAQRSRSTDTGAGRLSSACRWWRRGPSAPARNRRRAASGASPSARRVKPRLGGRQRLLDREQPRHHPLDIAVDRPSSADRRRSPRSPRRCRRRCRAACAEPFGVSGKRAAALHHRLRAGMQVARPRVVAEARPGPQHLLERRRRQLLDRRPALEEPRVIGRDRLHRGLLQHDLGQPDPVRIGRLARPRAPRQHAAMPVVPGEQRARVGQLVPRRFDRACLSGGDQLRCLPSVMARPM